MNLNARVDVNCGRKGQTENWTPIHWDLLKQVRQKTFMHFGYKVMKGTCLSNYFEVDPLARDLMFKALFDFFFFSSGGHLVH